MASEGTPSVLTYDVVQRASLKEIRQFCSQLNVDTSSFLEKHNFQDALLKHCIDVAPVLLETFDDNLARFTGALRIIFLDVDGVLNTIGTGLGFGDTSYGDSAGSSNLDDTLVRRLVSLLGDTDAQIVLSSSWRGDLALKMKLYRSLVEAGMPEACLVGQTPNIGFSARPQEIMQWIQAQPPQSIRAWVVLDDMDLSVPELQGHFIWCDPAVGLSDENIVVARRSLSC